MDMSTIAIVGAGMMGSAMCMPAHDNGHIVHLVGTHLDTEIIDQVNKDGVHPKLQCKLPETVKAFQFDEITSALQGVDFLIGGVSSFGVEWFCENVLPLVPPTLPVLMVTKGLVEHPDGSLETFPHYMNKQVNQKLSINAIGGPCTSYELADRRNSSVCFCGEDASILGKLKNLLETDYYHISVSTDVIGVESVVALKNAYALGVSLAIGLNEREKGVGCTEAYNPQAAIFGQAAREMAKIVRFLGGTDESIPFGVGDLYVTIFGGRTRKLGVLLGRGFSIQEALEELSGVTLESVAIAKRISSGLAKLAQRGLVNMDDFPLIKHIEEIINQGQPVNIPWKSFQHSFVD